MLGLVAKVLISYLLGSVIGSLVVGRLRGGVDIRTQGSGNAGGTNALRTQGRAFAAWVVLIDVGKGVLAVTLVAGAGGSAHAAPLDGLGLALACGAAAIVGHVWPVFYGFRGGKGAATFVGVLAVTAPITLVPVLLTWLVCLMLSGFVGLSTILAAWALPGYALVVGSGDMLDPLFVFGVAMAMFMTYTHRGNIERMRAGNENRFERAMLLRRRPR